MGFSRLLKVRGVAAAAPFRIRLGEARPQLPPTPAERGAESGRAGRLQPAGGGQIG